MRDVLIDFRECTDKREMHEIIRQKLELPEWYGANLDALWDALLGMTELPLHVCILTKKEKSQDMAVERIIDTFVDASQENSDITVEIIKE